MVGVLGGLLVPAPAVAKPAIAVLAFGGEDGAKVRTGLMRLLRARYNVLDGQDLLDACDELGIAMSRGPNLARAAKHIGAIGVVGGTAAGGRAAIAVYSGETGEPVLTSTLPSKNLAKLLQPVAKALRGLEAAPVKKAADPSQPIDKGGGGGGKEDGLTFEPDPVERPGTGTGQPKAGTGPAASAGGQASAAANPIGDGSSSSAALDYDPETPGGKGAKGGPSGGGAQTPAVADKPSADRPLRVAGTVGFGTWMRDFSLNDPVGTAPRYSSGAAFALRVGVDVRPVAFFTDGYPAGVFIRLRYQAALGLQSKIKDAGGDGFSTSLGELLLDFGYDWKIMQQSATSPHVEAGIGFGMMNFGIDWKTATKTLPDAAYRFVPIGVGLNWPFLSFMGAYVRGDYRVVLSSGEVEDENNWYGKSGTGGISLAIGVTGTWKKIIGSVEYAYTRYFYAFKDAVARQQAGKRAAGGALDLLHGFIANVGYSY